MGCKAPEIGTVSSQARFLGNKRLANKESFIAVVLSAHTAGNGVHRLASTAGEYLPFSDFVITLMGDLTIVFLIPQSVYFLLARRSKKLQGD
jgi:hypothetical protein